MFSREYITAYLNSGADEFCQFVETASPIVVLC
jgi:hypothetical protein